MTQHTKKTETEKYRGCSRTYDALKYRAIGGDEYATKAFMDLLDNAEKTVKAIEASRRKSPPAPSGDSTTPPYSVTLTFKPETYRQLQRLCLYEYVIMGFSEDMEGFIKHALSIAMEKEGRPELYDLDDGTTIGIEHFMPDILRPLAA